MENKAAVLILRSTSRNFPLDLQPELEKAGYHVVLLDSLDDYIASPARQNPYLAILEIGSTTDIDRALIVFEWTEIMHPAAAARFVLLMASKNIALGDSAKKFGAAEVAILPQPTRNLLFKVELHQRLLHAQPAATKRKREGFTVAYAPEETPGSRRVLLIRGQDEKAGKWEDAGLSPSGKVRWRWVKSPDPAAPAAPEGYAWIAEGKKAPEYSPQKQAWAMLGDDDDVVCLHKEKEIFSARKALEPKNKTGAAPAPAENTTNLSPRPDSAPNERKGNLFTPKPAGEKEDAAHPARAGLGAGEAAAGNSRPGATATGKTPAANADPASATKPSTANPAGQEAGTGGKALRETPAPAAWNVHQGAAKMGAGKHAVATSAAEETAPGVGGNKATETTVPASTVTPPSSFEPPSPESAARKDTERKQALPSTLLNLVKNAGQAPTEKTPEDKIPIPESAPSAEFTLAARPVTSCPTTYC